MEEVWQLVHEQFGKEPVSLNDIKRVLRNVKIEELEQGNDATDSVSCERFLAWLYDWQEPSTSPTPALGTLPAWGLRQILQNLDSLIECGMTQVTDMQQLLDQCGASEMQPVIDNEGGMRARVKEAAEVMITVGITEVMDLKECRRRVAGALVTSITGQQVDGKNVWMSDIELPAAYAQNGCKIPHPADRGISVTQLQCLGEFIKRVLDVRAKTISDDRSIDSLTWEAIDMFVVNDVFVKPMTSKRQVSFVELIANSKQTAAWYISYWWGTPFSQALRMLNLHSCERSLKPSDYYWMSSFADNQHRLSEEWQSTLENCSLMRVLHSEACQGMVALLDEKATPFTKLWTVLECFETVSTGRTYDMAAWLSRGAEFVGSECNDAQAVLLKDMTGSTGTILEEVSETRNPYGYSWSFPRSVAEIAARANFRDASVADPNDLEMLREHLKGREDIVNVAINKRFAPLAIYNAILRDDADGLLPLLEEHPEMITTDLDKFGHSAAFVAASQDAERALALLIDHKAAVDNRRQADGATPVYIAAFKGHMKALRLLIAASADIDAPSEDVGATPAFVAAERGNTAALEVLIAARADIQRCSKDGVAPAAAAAARNNRMALECLMAAEGSCISPSFS